MTGGPTHTASEEKMSLCAPAVDHRLKSEISIKLHCQLCSTHHTALQIKNYLKRTSTIKVVTMKNSVMKGSHHMPLSNRHFLLSAKMNGTQRRTLVSP